MKALWRLQLRAGRWRQQRCLSRRGLYCWSDVDNAWIAGYRAGLREAKRKRRTIYAG